MHQWWWKPHYRRACQPGSGLYLPQQTGDKSKCSKTSKISNISQAKLTAYCQYSQLHRNQTVMATSIPELGVVSNHRRDGSLSPNDEQRQQTSTCPSSHQHTLMAPVNSDEREVHVYAHPEEGPDELAEESEEVMLQIDLVVKAVVMWLFHGVPHFPMFLMPRVQLISTLQRHHRGVFVSSVVVSLLQCSITCPSSTV